MKKKNISIIILLIIVVLFTQFNVVFADGLDNIMSDSYVIGDLITGTSLFDKNGDKILYPSECIKILTAIIAIEKGDLSDPITISKSDLELVTDKSTILSESETISLEQALNIYLISSSDEIGYAISKYISGDINSFVDLMNAKASEIGTLHTKCTDPNGSYDVNSQSSAYDLFLISKYALNNEVFKNIIMKNHYTLPPTNKNINERTIKTDNRLLSSTKKIEINDQMVNIKYDGAHGIINTTSVQSKTCLITYVTKNNQSLILVLLNSNGNDIYVDAHRILDKAINSFEKTVLGFKDKLAGVFSVKNGDSPYVTGVLKDDAYYVLDNDIRSKITEKIEVKTPLVPPIQAGQSIGVMKYLNPDEEPIAEIEIISTTDVKPFKAKFFNFPVFICSLIALFIIIVLVLTNINLKKRLKRYRLKLRNLKNNIN